MGLFGFGLKKKNDTDKLTEIINSDFGTLAREVFCNPIKAMERICETFDCSAHFAFVPERDSSGAPMKYPVYTLKIIMGEITRWDGLGLLRDIFTGSEQERYEFLERYFCMDGSQAGALDSCGLRYICNEPEDTIEFYSNNVMSFLKYADVRYHLKALGQTIHKELPDASVSVTSQMVFVMLNGNEPGKYEEK